MGISPPEWDRNEIHGISIQYLPEIHGNTTSAGPKRLPEMVCYQNFPANSQRCILSFRQNAKHFFTPNSFSNFSCLLQIQTEVGKVLCKHDADTWSPNSIGTIGYLVVNTSGAAPLQKASDRCGLCKVLGPETQQALATDDSRAVVLNWQHFAHGMAGKQPIWRFPKMGAPPNHPFIDGFSIVNHPILGFFGYPYFRNHPYFEV